MNQIVQFWNDSFPNEDYNNVPVRVVLENEDYNNESDPPIFMFPNEDYNYVPDLLSLDF